MYRAECRVVREKAAYTVDVVRCTYTRRGRQEMPRVEHGNRLLQIVLR
jgi:hypothetical protein